MKRAPIKKDLTAEFVRKLFDYDPVSGFVVHKERLGVTAGARAGCVNSGYRRLKIHQESYLEHRIIWLWVTGEWPVNEVDHIDLVKTNNQWGNLREANRVQNSMNSPTRTTRKYGTLKGARYQSNGTWQAQISKFGRNRHLGTFATEAEAHAAYFVAAKEIDGEFARAA